jgi:hypothetical protein
MLADELGDLSNEVYTRLNGDPIETKKMLNSFIHPEPES